MVMEFNFSLHPISRKDTSLQIIEEFLKDSNTKRIHFATSHKDAIKKPSDNNKNGKLILPFDDTIEHIISKEIEISERFLFPSKFEGVWRAFKTEEEYERCRGFVDKYNQTVFLRDTLELSLALSMNMTDEDTRTEIGELIHEAKYKNSRDHEQKIVELVQNWLNELPYYNEANVICAMPCSDKENHSLPRRIVDEIEGYENISEFVNWRNKSKSLKDINTIEEKLAAIQEFDLEITSDLKGKNVILLDDLYMSGLSMQYVAMKLKENGAERVFGISIVKSRSNTAL